LARSADYGYDLLICGSHVQGASLSCYPLMPILLM
jgi:hypothetical protein